MKIRTLLPLFMVLLIAMMLMVQSTVANPIVNTVVFDDMEHGDPWGNGWFAFNGSVGGGGFGPNDTDLPPIQGGAFSLETGWGSGGAPGFFGGFGRIYPTDLTGTEFFNFWINPDAGQDYILEINLQDDDNGDGTISPAEDDEFQFNCVISPTGPCATSGGGWQHVAIPLADFDVDYTYLYGGNGILDTVPATAGGNGQLINVVIAVISNSGADVTFRTDYWNFSNAIVDDFESGLPSGSDSNSNTIGFFTFADSSGSTVSISTTESPPQPVPEKADPNNVLQVDTSVVSGGWAGLVHAFENEALDTWTPQDWSGYEGFSLWLYGNNTGKTLFIDILDNRVPGSTGDTAERYSIDIPDDFFGWQFFQIPFADFHRKEVGNGAPNDGFTLTEVHGWAFGVFSSAEPFTNYLDDVGLYGVAEIPELSVSFTTNAYEVVEGDTAVVAVSLNRPMGQENDPEQVTVSYSTADGTATSDRDYTPASGTFTFVAGEPSEQTFTVPTVDNGKYEGGKTILLYLTEQEGALLGPVFKARIDITDDEVYDPNLLDDFEQGIYLWRSSDNVVLSNPEIMAGDPLALPGQGAYEQILEATTPILVDIVVEGNLCNRGNGVVTVALLTTDSFDALSVDQNSVLFGDAAETHVNKKTGEARRHEEDFDGDGDLDLIFHFRVNETGYDCDSTEVTLTGETFDGQLIISGGEGGFFRDFAIGQDWTDGEALSFWFYGTDSGDPITVQLKDNRKPGNGQWSLVWSDEFDDPAGTPPNPANWTPEIGDGTINANPGWGNSELEYYTDSVENAATDGNGKLVITAKESDDSLTCYYGPCEYTSARLISWHKAEFAHGRIEARLQVPFGQGLWPAFWALGTDIGEVGWPQSGELDIMEHIGREPTWVYGTIHGPGYSGGAGVGAGYENPDGEAFSDDFHVYAVEWEPDEIRWYVDDVQFFSATPDDASGEWVFNHPFFIILNVAVGGNWPGYPDETTVFPQTMHVDYVRVYQGPDTAERFEATFTDSFSGWQQVVIPFTSFTRSADQPPGARDDGLTLSEVWGYGFELPEGGTTSGTMRLDQVRLELIPPPTEITVTNLNDSGDGSLRQALEDIAIGGTITFDPALAGGTLVLTTGPLVPVHSVTVDAADAPGIIMDGGSIDRVMIVDAGLTVNLIGLTVANGYGWDLAGGILNNGTLNMDNCTVTNSIADTGSFDPSTDYWKGGGGIYNGSGAVLNLVDSTVSDNNSTLMDGGGIYAFPGSTTDIVRSTISGNTAGNTGGGIRMLGDASIVNSTISGNTATGWHGSAIFHTDGVMEILNSTIANNVAPDSGSSTIFLGSYSSVVPVLTLTNTIITGNQWYACEQNASGGTVSLVSGGHNLVQDDSCNPVASDQIAVDAGLGPLADNGGPTWTHALLAGSLAIDTADDTICPAIDQRGVARPQGAGCDVGSYEMESNQVASFANLGMPQLFLPIMSRK